MFGPNSSTVSLHTAVFDGLGGGVRKYSQVRKKGLEEFERMEAGLVWEPDRRSYGKGQLGIPRQFCRDSQGSGGLQLGQDGGLGGAGVEKGVCPPEIAVDPKPAHQIGIGLYSGQIGPSILSGQACMPREEIKEA